MYKQTIWIYRYVQLADIDHFYKKEILKVLSAWFKDLAREKVLFQPSFVEMTSVKTLPKLLTDSPSHFSVWHQTLFQPLYAPYSLSPSVRTWLGYQHTSLCCASLTPLSFPPLPCPPAAFVDSNPGWPSAGLCRARAKTGRGNRRVSVEEAACLHVLALQEEVCDAITQWVKFMSNQVF